MRQKGRGRKYEKQQKGMERGREAFKPEPRLDGYVLLTDPLYILPFILVFFFR